MVINGSTVIRRNPRVVHRNLAGDEGAVLLNLDTSAYHGINEVGALVWTLLDEDRTFDELLQDVRAHLEDPPQELAADISEFLGGLNSRNLVEIDAVTAPPDQR